MSTLNRLHTLLLNNCVIIWIICKIYRNPTEIAWRFPLIYHNQGKQRHVIACSQPEFRALINHLWTLSWNGIWIWKQKSLCGDKAGSWSTRLWLWPVVTSSTNPSKHTGLAYCAIPIFLCWLEGLASLLLLLQIMWQIVVILNGCKKSILYKSSAYFSHIQTFHLDHWYLVQLKTADCFSPSLPSLRNINHN